MKWRQTWIDIFVEQKRIVALEEENAQVKSQVLRDSQKIRRLEEIADKALNDTNLAGIILKIYPHIIHTVSSLLAKPCLDYRFLKQWRI